MSIVENAVRFAEDIANDNSHGYSQQSRWPEQGSDFDCSSLIIQAWENAGVPVKSRGASWTGNMYSVFMSCGFRDVTSQINLNSGAGLQRGDVLLNHVNHTAMVTGPGKIVHARSSEGNSMPGDQSGNEIRIQNYWNYPWNAVLRYPEEQNPAGDLEGEEPAGPKETAYLHLEYGDGLNAPLKRIKAAQILLNLQGGWITLEEDGEFGTLTESAVTEFQKKRGLEPSGVIDGLTWKELIKFEV